MLRREFTSALCGLAFARFANSIAHSRRGPLFWLAKRGKARVFVLGFADAKADERPWFTSTIERAFAESFELWLETAPPSPDVAARLNAAKLTQELGRESGRTLFDALEPSVRERTLAWIEALGIDKQSIATRRPWSAYYVIVSAFWSKRHLPYKLENVDEVLRTLATDAGKVVNYEMPTSEAFVRFMAGMSDRAQSQYVEWVLDYIDDETRGLNDAGFDWQFGKPMSRSLDRMRTKMPDLYRVMQLQRNEWWARKIDSLLATSGTHFLAIGQLHVLGPDGIPAQLQRLGFARSRSLLENPSF